MTGAPSAGPLDFTVSCTKNSPVHRTQHSSRSVQWRCISKQWTLHLFHAFWTAFFAHVEIQGHQRVVAKLQKQYNQLTMPGAGAGSAESRCGRTHALPILSLVKVKIPQQPATLRRSFQGTAASAGQKQVQSSQFSAQTGAFSFLCSPISKSS